MNDLCLNCSCACIWDLRPNNITDQWLLLQDESDFRSGPAVIASHWAVPVRRFARVVHDAERLTTRCQSLQDSSKIYVFYTFLYWFFFFWWLRETGQGVSGYTSRAILFPSWCGTCGILGIDPTLVKAQITQRRRRRRRTVVVVSLFVAKKEPPPDNF